MTDADALSDLVRVGLRNPARVVVKVRSKNVKTTLDNSKVVEERRTPARFYLLRPLKAHNLIFRYSACRTIISVVDLLRSWSS